MARVGTTNTLYTSGRQVLADHATLLLSLGFTCPYYSTGSSYVSNGAGFAPSVITAGTNRGWHALRAPNGRQEWLWQWFTNTYDWRVKCSPLAHFTGGSPSATVTPSAADEMTLFGGGTDASPTNGSLFPLSGTWRGHIVAENAAINGQWPWWYYSHTQGTTTINTLMFQDVMIPGSEPTGDTDPSAYACGTTAPTINMRIGQNTGSPLNITQAWATTQGLFDGTKSQDPHALADPRGAWTYGNANYIKGLAHGLKLKAIARPYGNTTALATDNYVYLGSTVAGHLLPGVNGVAGVL